MAAAVGIAGVLATVGPRVGRLAVVIWLPRLLAQAWSPVVAAAGTIVGSVALLAGRSRLALVALGGVGLAACYGATALGRSAAARLPATIGRCQPDVEVGRLGTGEAVLADLWLPVRERPRSGVGIVYLHGGLWQAIDKGFGNAPLMRMLTAEGHVVLDVAYPLAPGAPLKAMDDAVGLAVRWLSQEGSAEGVRADRIVLVGHAGGGHLALVHAFRGARRDAVRGSDPPPIRGVAAISAVTDPVAFWVDYGRVNRRQPRPGEPVPADLRPRLHDTTPLDRLVTRLRLFPAYRYGNWPGGPALVHDLFGGTPSDAPDRYAAWSPAELAAPGCPPVLQIVGSHDAIIPASQGRVLHESLLSAGCPSTLVEIPLAVHGFDQYPGVSRRVAPAARRTTATLLAFIDELS
ncbi:MAG: alpha/beta hydrolase [Chloroflexota bacterium]